MKRPFINTVEAAVRFLKRLEMEVIETEGGWIVHGLGLFNDDFELTCDTPAELIQYVREQRDNYVRLWTELGVTNSAENSRSESSSSTAVAAPATADRGSDSAGMSLENSKEDKK